MEDLRESLEFVADLKEEAIGKYRSTSTHEDGRVFWNDTGELLMPAAPDALSFATLGGLAAYIAANRDAMPLEKCMLRVGGPAAVQLLQAADDVYRRRLIIAAAQPPALPRHRWGEYLDGEEFIIWLLSAFVHDESTALILRIVGNLKAEKVTSVIDDGVTQVAAVRAGVQRVGEVEVRNPFMLRPYRSFSEVEQPQGPFILRLKETNGGGGAPKVALFESADASWIGTAMVDVASRLADHLNTFAVSNVPVLV